MTQPDPPEVPGHTPDVFALFGPAGTSEPPAPGEDERDPPVWLVEDPVTRLPGMDPARDASTALAVLDAPPWRADQPGRGWLAAQTDAPCVWCGQPTTTLVGTVHVGVDGCVEVDASAAHPGCEQAHFAHGLRVARVLARVLAARPSSLEVWAQLRARSVHGPAARTLAADLVASDGVFVLPEAAGHRLLREPAACRRCTLPAMAAVHLEGIGVVGPQHWDCVEARTYQGLAVTTLADELYPG